LLEIQGIIRLPGSLGFGLRRRLGSQLDLLFLAVLRGGGHLQCAKQLLRIDRIRERLKQLERPQAPAQQLQPLALGREYPQHGRPLLGHSAEQLQPRSVFQTFRGHDDLVRIGPEQVETVAFVAYTVDSVKIPERSGDRQVAGGILVDNEHTHAANVTGHPRHSSAAGVTVSIFWPYTQC
jgi:hypothetical protein